MGGSPAVLCKSFFVQVVELCLKVYPSSSLAVRPQCLPGLYVQILLCGVVGQGILASFLRKVRR